MSSCKLYLNGNITKDDAIKIYNNLCGQPQIPTKKEFLDSIFSNDSRYDRKILVMYEYKHDFATLIQMELLTKLQWFILNKIGFEGDFGYEGQGCAYIPDLEFDDYNWSIVKDKYAIEYAMKNDINKETNDLSDHINNKVTEKEMKKYKKQWTLLQKSI
jgi:hypothetical protein